MYQKLKLREFNIRMNRLKFAKKQRLVRKKEKTEGLHIVYVMSHVGICGGVKIIFEHTNRLLKLGARVSIVSHFPKPDWFPIKAAYYQVPFDIELAKGIPFCDVIVTTYWDHIQPCIETGIAPVIYFEQGDYHLYDYASMNPKLEHFVQTQLQLPEYVITVSNIASDSLKKYYDRKSLVFPNAIDENCFKLSGERYIHNKPYILMMGEEYSSFKGLDDIIKAFELLKQDGFDLDLLWITPYQPTGKLTSSVSAYFVNPTQKEIANLYRGAEVYISGSHYESFPLPPLEAMACGCPVISTGNQGVLEYAIHSENALICKISDPYDLAEKTRALLSNSELKHGLVEKGLQTASNFKWDTIMLNLYNYFKDISCYLPHPLHDLAADWEIIVSPGDFFLEDEYKKFLSLLKVTNAAIIKAPVIYDLEDLPKIVRWETVANRKASQTSTTDFCYTVVKPKNKFAILNNDAYLYFFKKEYEKALAEFATLFEQNKSTIISDIYFKWIILTLQRLQRRYEAKEKLREFLRKNPFSSEAYYLYFTLTESDDKDRSYYLNMVDVLGDEAAKTEHLYNIRLD